MALLTATTSAISISSCLLQSLNHLSFSHRIYSPNTPNISFSCNFLHIQSQKKLENFSGGKKNEQKQSSSHQNASSFLAELKALDVHQTHKNTASKTPPNQKRTSIPKNPNPKNEDSKLSNRASSESPLRGEDFMLALQRAALEKAKERSRKSKQKAARKTKEGKGFQEMTKEKRRVIGEVRPITLIPQWSAKIKNLENRLKELKEKADLT